MNSPLQKSHGQVVSRSGQCRCRREKGKGRARGGRFEVAGAGMVAGSSSMIERAARRKAKMGSCSGDWKSKAKSLAVHRVGANGDDGIQSTKHRKPKDGVDSDIGAQSKGKSDGGSRHIDIGGVISNHRGQIAVIGGVEIFRIPNGTTELDGFKGIGVVERSELSNQVGSFGLQPKVEGKVSCVEGCTGVHKATKGWVNLRICAQIKG